MNDEQQRIIAALQKVEGLRDIHVTPYGEVAWLTNNSHNHWLAKNWNDFCRALGTMAETGVLRLNRNP